MVKLVNDSMKRRELFIYLPPQDILRRHAQCSELLQTWDEWINMPMTLWLSLLALFIKRRHWYKGMNSSYFSVWRVIKARKKEKIDFNILLRPWRSWKGEQDSATRRPLKIFLQIFLSAWWPLMVASYILELFRYYQRTENITTN